MLLLENRKPSTQSCATEPCVTVMPQTDIGTLAKAQSELRRSSYRELGGLQCELCEGTLILRGSVPRFFLKQMAQVLVGRLPDVLNVDNQIHVAAPR